MVNFIKTNAEDFAPLVDEQDAPLDELTVIGSWRNKANVKQRKVLGFSMRGRARKNDLDLTAINLNARGQVISACSVEDIDPERGAEVHAGDDDGSGAASQEEIKLHLSRLSGQIQAVAFTLTSFTGTGFDNLNGCGFELYVGNTLAVEVRVPISERGRNAALLALVRRTVADPARWEIIESATQLVTIDPHFEGNRDSAVNWQDLTGQLAPLTRRAFN